MTITALPLASGILTTGAVTYLTAPVNTTYVLKRLNFNNTTAGAVTFTATFWDGSAFREMISVKPLAAHKSDQAPELVGLTLTPGMYIQMLSDTNTAVTFSINGISSV